MTRSRVLVLAVLMAIVAPSATDIASAKGAPFGAPHPAAAAPASNFMGWMFAEQAAFYRSLSGLIRASRVSAV
ncbi:MULTISPECIES: hypothetical protein [unclassified Bradyrhizobium]